MSLQRVEQTKNCCILFFLERTVILVKSTLEKLKELSDPFDGVLEIDSHLIFFCRHSNLILKVPLNNSKTREYILPPKHNLISIEGCPEKKFLVGITQNPELDTYAVVFWVWDNSQFSYVFDEKIRLEGVKLLDKDRLVVYGKSHFKIFDSEKVKFVQSVQVDGEIRKVFLSRKDRLLLVFSDDTHFSLNLKTRETKLLGEPGKEGALVFLETPKILIDLNDLNSVQSIKF